MPKFRMIILLSMSISLLLTPGCGKKAMYKQSVSAGLNSNTLPITKKENTNSEPVFKEGLVPNHNIGKIDLGEAKDFSVMAYTSISSTSGSKIKGKVGLKPGLRSLINIDPANEVSGGVIDIYAADDVGIPAEFLNKAKEDLVSAYRDAVSRPTDNDKIEIFSGNLGGQILPSGIYRWSNGINITSDMTLYGNDKDFFIFQIAGSMTVEDNVKIILKGGVLAKNVFWQVSRKVLLKSSSVLVGTIMSQLTFDMKNLAQLNGRAFVKNGKLVLSQSTITKPE